MFESCTIARTPFRQSAYYLSQGENVIKIPDISIYIGDCNRLDFQYMQIRHFIQKNYTIEQLSHSLMGFEKMLLQFNNDHLYKLLNRNIVEVNSAKTKREWDLQM